MTNERSRFIFMKVGNHANETWDRILERKRREFQQAGRIFWGYGGTACHPINQVQPFARLSIREGEQIELLMEPISSSADQDAVAATEYSEDGVEWREIPSGIVVTGSRYALILDEIKECDLTIPIERYQVGIGPSRGKSGADYLKGRVDKACLEILPTAATASRTGPSSMGGAGRLVKFRANLLDPYAVLLRSRQRRS